jgi:hypothetical protein
MDRLGECGVEAGTEHRTAIRFVQQEHLMGDRRRLRGGRHLRCQSFGYADDNEATERGDESGACGFLHGFIIEDREEPGL